VFGLELLNLKDAPDKHFVSVPARKGPEHSGRVWISKLAKAGYVEKSAPTKIGFNFQTYDGYLLTEKGRKYIRWNEGVCVGRSRVTGIVEYTEPADLGGMTFTRVTYSYETDFNEIVKDLGLEAELRGDRFGLDGKGKATFVKTNRGWRLE